MEEMIDFILSSTKCVLYVSLRAPSEIKLQQWSIFPQCRHPQTLFPKLFSLFSPFLSQFHWPVRKSLEACCCAAYEDFLW